MAHGAQNTVQLETTPLSPEYIAADRANDLIICCGCFIAIESIAFALRLHARKLRKIPLGWSDALVFFALVLNIAMIVIAITCATIGGVGKHIRVAILKGYTTWWADLAGLIIFPVTYSVALLASKGAILDLFLRTFTGRAERLITQAVLVIIVIDCTAKVFISIFQCNPVSDTWRSKIRPNCLDTQRFFQYSCLPNLITDIIILLLPIPTVWSLNVSKRAKLGVWFMFLTITIGIISSVIRTVGFFHDSTVFIDPTWAAGPLFAYSIAEAGTYFLAACASSYKVLGRYLTFKRMHAILSKCGMSQRRPDLDYQVSNEGKSDREGRFVRGFNSIILSKIDKGEDNTSSDSHV